MSHDTFSIDADRAVLAASMIYFSHSNISILKRHFSDIYKIQMCKVYIFKYKCCRTDVGGQCYPDSVRIYCAVSVGENQGQIRNPGTRKPSRLKVSDFDGQTPYSKSGQNPDSAVRRRLPDGHLVRMRTPLYYC